jgi:hypothetical protein
MNMKSILAILAILTLSGRNTYAAGYEVHIEPGSIDRSHAVLKFPLPEGEGPWSLKRGDVIVPVQSVDDEGVAIIPDVVGGTPQTWTLVTGNNPGPVFDAHEEGGTLVFRAFNRELMRFQIAKSTPPHGVDPIDARSGYIFPIFTPSGRLVLGDYSPVQPHQHGLWSAWSKTDIDGRHPDFWNLQEKTGYVECARLIRYWAGPVTAGFEAELNYVDASTAEKKVMLKETWKVSLYVAGWHDAQPSWMLDLESSQKCTTPSPVKFTPYFYGGVAFRGNDQWLQADKALVMDSNGTTIREQVQGARASWAYLGGVIDGQVAGIAMLSHPGNFRFPQNIRMHRSYPYLGMTPCQQGEWMIAPDAPYYARFRFIIGDGPPVFAHINQLWQDYADPIMAKLRLVRP